MLKVVQVANTPQARTLGLGNFRKLEKGEAFLLAFDQPQMVSIWNKGVPYSIDVGFVNEKGELFQIEQLPADQKEWGNQNPLVFSKVPAVLAIETLRGELKQNYRLGQTVDQIITGEESDVGPEDKENKDVQKAQEREELDQFEQALQNKLQNNK